MIFTEIRAANFPLRKEGELFCLDLCSTYFCTYSRRILTLPMSKVRGGAASKRHTRKHIKAVDEADNGEGWGLALHCLSVTPGIVGEPANIYYLLSINYYLIMQ